jgi:hypothetical protein
MGYMRKMRKLLLTMNVFQTIRIIPSYRNYKRIPDGRYKMATKRSPIQYHLHYNASIAILFIRCGYSVLRYALRRIYFRIVLMQSLG